MEFWNLGLGVIGSLITLAISGVCPGNNGFSSVICTSCSSVMVAWQGKETPRLGRLPPHPPISSNSFFLSQNRALQGAGPQELMPPGHREPLLTQLHVQAIGEKSCIRGTRTALLFRLNPHCSPNTHTLRHIHPPFLDGNTSCGAGQLRFRGHSVLPIR